MFLQVKCHSTNKDYVGEGVEKYILKTFTGRKCHGMNCRGIKSDGMKSHAMKCYLKSFFMAKCHVGKISFKKYKNSCY